MARLALLAGLGLALAGCPSHDDTSDTVDTDTVDTDTTGVVDTDPPKDTDVPAGHASCLDRPGVLPTPPTGALPCELLPPGFGE